MNIDDDNQISIEILKNNIKLDRPCWYCTECYDFDNNTNYSQMTITKITKDNCEECKNKRFLLTEEGVAIIKLMKRHG